ncbi:hypothetical protein PVIIG_06072 [Plasmodium vivax India VII]|uniref:Fam-l protein n=1 Tax=Plasmodium vivax India VII TaxID=1077284 RepID=A0A0J9S2N6_PLAVI|nr:hypothetical protein PVIIG_06072 [Plasmodium vivax India VII]
MVSLSNYYQEINLKFTTFLKSFTFIFLIWTYITYNDMVRAKQNKYEQGNILKRNLHRLLAKHELHKELRHKGRGAQLLHDSIGKSKKYVADNISISSQLNKKGSNNVETYMKNYKRRYAKKKGVSKLDCYCEKKVFDKINYIYTLSDKMRNDKKGFKNKIRKKYGIGLIILSLIPALGLIYYILFGCGKGFRGVFELCANKDHYVSRNHVTTNGCTLLYRDVWDQTLGNIGLANGIFSFTMITIVLFFFIYIFIKVIKYKKLKAGKDKMSIKEYYRFTKSLL